MQYKWIASSDDGAYNEKSALFPTQEQCYMDMMRTAIDKMKWNVEWDDVDDCSREENGVIKSDFSIGYSATFAPDKITHESYSGLYTYQIVAVDGE